MALETTLSYSTVHSVLSALRVTIELDQAKFDTISQLLVQRALVPEREAAAKSIGTAMQLGLILQDGQVLQLSVRAKEIVQLEEVLALREVFRDFLLQSHRHLLWLAHLDESKVLEVSEHLHRTAKMLKFWTPSFESLNKVFWKEIRAAGKFSPSDSKLELGRKSEEKTVMFERNRLSKAGYPSLALQVKWLSLESDLHGYDILSFRGGGSNPGSPLHIEVKSAGYGNSIRPFFYLSRNEYNQARALSDSYLFHVWLPTNDLESGPQIIQGAQVVRIIPEMNDESQTEWTERKVFLSAFSA